MSVIQPEMARSIGNCLWIVCVIIDWLPLRSKLDKRLCVNYIKERVSQYRVFANTLGTCRNSV